MSKLIKLPDIIYSQLMVCLYNHEESDLAGIIEKNTTIIEGPTEEELEKAKYAIGVMKSFMESEMDSNNKTSKNKRKTSGGA